MAKCYYAKMHVAVGDFVARPGEVIEGDFSKEDIDRWLKIGAICECGEPEGVPYDEPTEPEAAPDPEPAETGNEEDSADPDDEEAESEDVEPEPAQIDVMDGITPAPAPTDSAAPKTTRKARGGKTK